MDVYVCVLMDVIHFYSLDLLIFNLFLTLNTSKRLGKVRNRRRSDDFHIYIRVG